MQNHVMNTYGRMPVNFVSGAGSYLTDSEGKTYFDGLTGIAVCGLCHAHPHVAQALAHQAQTLLHTSNLYEIPLQTKLANRLCERSGMDSVFFSNSGAEANEAAIKLARLKGNNEGIKSPAVIVVDGSFQRIHVLHDGRAAHFPAGADFNQSHDERGSKQAALRASSQWKDAVLRIDLICVSAILQQGLHAPCVPIL